MFKIDNVTQYSRELDGFNDWLLDQVYRQNIRYIHTNDYLYLQEIAEFSNTHFQVLKNMDYLSYDSKISKLYNSFKGVKSELTDLENKQLLDSLIEIVRKDPLQYQILFPMYKEITIRANCYKKDKSINYAKVEQFIKKLCGNKINRKAISQAFYRFRVRKNVT